MMSGVFLSLSSPSARTGSKLLKEPYQVCVDISNGQKRMIGQLMAINGKPTQPRSTKQ